jgi:hypothetical protein
MKVRLLPGPLPDMRASCANLTAVMAITPQWCLAGYDGLSGKWILATNRLAADPADWLHLTVKKDYAAGSWSLYRDGVPVLMKREKEDHPLFFPISNRYFYTNFISALPRVLRGGSAWSRRWPPTSRRCAQQGSSARGIVNSILQSGDASPHALEARLLKMWT